MNIDSYTFGEIVIDGKTYKSDVIVFEKKVKENWWRKEGHKLLIEDLQEVIKHNPKTIIIGTGYSGMMKVATETINLLKSKKIDLIYKPTSEAIKIFNSYENKSSIIGAFHLTC